MAFKEHRGGGREHRPVSTMESRWDSAWVQSRNEIQISQLASDENWAWMSNFLKKQSRILEAGCGLAIWVKFLQEQGYDVWGVDYSMEAIERSKVVWPDLKLQKGDIRALPFENNFFDGIVSIGAIEHDINGPETSLKEMYRVLRPDGILYCTVPCMNYSKRLGLIALQDWIVRNRTIRKLTGRNPDDVEFFEYVFEPEEYINILKSTGFILLKLVPLGPHSLYLGSKGSFRSKIIGSIHTSWPWVFAHMMAGICRKAN